MSDTSEDFANRPFTKLAGGTRFAQNAKSSVASQQPSLDDAADRALFLKAVNSIKAPRDVPKTIGFHIADLDGWQHMKFNQKKISKNIVFKPKPSPPPPTPNDVDTERDAFLWAMRDAKPLQGGARVASPKITRQQPRVAEASFEELMSGKLEFSLLYSDEYLEGKVSGLDEMIMNRLRAGQMSPEAHLDLHGLNASQAYESLRVFMRDAWFKGLRMVLLVPGRGKNSPAGMGILRQKMQSWLTQDPFKRVVLAFCTAQPHDGGPGSIYVLLRKSRKKGRIYWERMPADADLY